MEKNPAETLEPGASEIEGKERVEEERRIEDVDKAREMAQSEYYYRSLAINARKAGFENLAKDYEKKADEKAREAEKRWESKKETAEEIIRLVLERIFNELKKISNKVNREKAFIDVPRDEFTLTKLKQVLNVSEEPYSYDLNSSFHRTGIDKVVYVKNRFKSGEYPDQGGILVYPDEEWENELKEMKPTQEQK